MGEEERRELPERRPFFLGGRLRGDMWSPTETGTGALGRQHRGIERELRAFNRMEQVLACSAVGGKQRLQGSGICRGRQCMQAQPTAGGCHQLGCRWLGIGGYPTQPGRRVSRSGMNQHRRGTRLVVHGEGELQQAVPKQQPLHRHPELHRPLRCDRQSPLWQPNVRRALHGDAEFLVDCPAIGAVGDDACAAPARDIDLGGDAESDAADVEQQLPLI